MSDIGETLKNLRLRKSFSQKEVAKEIGITRQGYGQYERGEAIPSPTKMRRLSEVFGVTTDEILNGIPENSNGSYNNVYFAPSEIAEPLASYGKYSTYVPFLGEAPEQYMFQMVGDHMIPTLNPGDWYVALKIEWKEIGQHEDSIFRVDMDNSSFCRRLRTILNSKDENHGMIEAYADNERIKSKILDSEGDGDIYLVTKRVRVESI